MSLRWRIVVLAVLVVVVAVGTTFVLTRRSAEQSQAVAAASAAPSVAMSELAAGPRVVFRHTGLGADYGKAAAVSLADSTGPRAFYNVACERLYAVPSRTVCLYRDAGLVTTYQGQVGDGSFANPAPLPLTGLPSRARLTADGSLVATTTFVSGDSYLSQGFSTRTYVTTLATGESQHVEDFALVHEGQPVNPVDRNYWGITFSADDHTFYLTASWAGKTWLAKGDLRTRTITTIAENVECPSLSPDETRVAFKKRVGTGANPWRLMVRDLASGVESNVAEQRSVDDQVVWLDNSTLAYALPRTAPGVATSDIWSVPADGSGSPQVLVADAFSPTVQSAS
ncbi:MAG: hypothetical protein WCG47_04605 [Dermatophilaceae bacterium]